MQLRRPRRLDDFEYIGEIAYSVTISTFHRVRAFSDREFARLAREKLLRTADKFGFSLIAYCLMPDHVHLLPLGVRTDSDFEAFIRSWNTQTGYAWLRNHSTKLWQEGYYERVIRNDVNLYLAARYIVMNPVRARLVEEATAYEFCGSMRYTIEELLDDGYAPYDEPEGSSPHDFSGARRT